MKTWHIFPSYLGAFLLNAKLLQKLQNFGVFLHQGVKSGPPWSEGMRHHRLKKMSIEASKEFSYKQLEPRGLREGEGAAGCRTAWAAGFHNPSLSEALLQKAESRWLAQPLSSRETRDISEHLWLHFRKGVIGYWILSPLFVSSLFLPPRNKVLFIKHLIPCFSSGEDKPFFGVFSQISGERFKMDVYYQFFKVWIWITSYCSKSSLGKSHRDKQAFDKLVKRNAIFG